MLSVAIISSKCIPEEVGENFSSVQEAQGGDHPLDYLPDETKFTQWPQTDLKLTFWLTINVYLILYLILKEVGCFLEDSTWASWQET